jgi:hypothetical protein
MGGNTQLFLISVGLNPADFPYLDSEGFTPTSPRNPRYNCIAWAAGQTARWWWPDPQGQAFWPAGVPRALTIAAFIATYQTLGFLPCPDGSLEAGFEKIAIYALGGAPTHAARQLTDGTWTSKLGRSVDLSTTLRGVEGRLYGSVCQFLKRPAPTATPAAV